MESEHGCHMSSAEVSALARGLRLLDVLADRATLRGTSLTELAQTTGLNKATAFRLLGTLRSHGYVEKHPDTERYHLGLSILHLSSALLQNLDLCIQAAPVMSDLVQRTNETVHLGVLDRGSVVYIDKVECGNSVRMHSRVGMQMPAYSTGLGKAILAKTWVHCRAVGGGKIGPRPSHAEHDHGCQDDARAPVSEARARG